MPSGNRTQKSSLGLAVMHGEDAAGVELMQSGFAGWQDMGMVIGTDSLAIVLADRCLAAARRRQQSDDAVRNSLFATALAAIELLPGPKVRVLPRSPDRTHPEPHTIAVKQFLEMLRFENRSKLAELPEELVKG